MRNTGFLVRGGLLALCLCAGAAKAQVTDSTAGADTTATVDSTAAVDKTVATDTVAQTEESTFEDSAWYNPGIDPVHLQPRHVPPADVARLKKDDDFWYVSVGPDKAKPEPEKKPEKETAWERFWAKVGALLSQPWASFMLWTLLVGVAVAALVAIIQAGSGQSMFRRNRKLKGKETGDKEAEDLAADPNAELTKALEARDYGAAERWLYIRALSGLGDRGLIRHHPEKTNREYLRELRGHPLYDDFAPLLRHYEYTFYGGFAPSATVFENIREQYTRFQNRLEAL